MENIQPVAVGQLFHKKRQVAVHCQLGVIQRVGKVFAEAAGQGDKALPFAQPVLNLRPGVGYFRVEHAVTLAGALGQNAF